jgi:hypothetical protein
MATSPPVIMTELVKAFLFWKRDTMPLQEVLRKILNNNIEPLPQSRNKFNSIKFINEQKPIN